MPNGGPSTEAPVNRAPRRVPVPRPVAPPTGPVSVRWPVRTSEHVDLWLHAFALLEPDSAPSPLYRRGYRDSVTVVKNRAGLFTTLDRNAAFLSKGLSRSPSLLSAQLLPLQVPNWDVLHTVAERFVQSDGDARGVKDDATATLLTDLGRAFPTAEDRAWFGSLIVALVDERRAFYADDHSRVERSRAAVVTAVDSLWQSTYKQRFTRFLANTNQASGELLLSIPVGVEGRMSLGSNGRLTVVVPFPDRVSDASQAIVVMAHEITGSVVREVLSASAETNRALAGVTQVRAGAALLERVAPELVEPYMRVYLSAYAGLRDARSGDARSGAADVRAAFQSRFALSEPMMTSLTRQIDLVLNGT